MNDNPKWEIIQGDALQLLPNFAPGTFDAVITDPPYASGGRTQAEKNKSTAKTYSRMGAQRPAMPSSGRGGSGAAPLAGTRATAGPRRAGSGSRRSTLSGAPMVICPSAARCPASPVYSSTAIPRTAST